MDVALKAFKFLKVGCFAHTLNLAAQKVYSITAVTKVVCQTWSCHGVAEEVHHGQNSPAGEATTSW